MKDNYSLICPFLTDAPEFARGVELGMLFARMQKTNGVKDYFQMANQDQVLLLAARLGWTVTKIKAWGKDWFWCVMRRRITGTNVDGTTVDLK